LCVVLALAVQADRITVGLLVVVVNGWSDGKMDLKEKEVEEKN